MEMKYFRYLLLKKVQQSCLTITVNYTMYSNRTKIKWVLQYMIYKVLYRGNIIPSNIKNKKIYDIKNKKRFGDINKNGRNKSIKKIVKREKIKE